MYAFFQNQQLSAMRRDKAAADEERRTLALEKQALERERDELKV